MEKRRAKRTIDKEPRISPSDIEKNDEELAKKRADYAKKEDEFLNLIAEIIVNIIMEEDK